MKGELPMKIDTTANRLREYMRIYNMKQADIVAEAQPYCQELNVKINKSDISQYLSGKVVPGNDKVYVLAVALGLNPSWLVGYDEPMYKTSEQEKFREENCNHEENKKLTQEDEQRNNLISKIKEATPEQVKILSDVFALVQSRAEGSEHQNNQET